MRDRLVELLTETFDEQYQATRLIMPEQTADHLLANGVIVPPCKVGDTVYVAKLNLCGAHQTKAFIITHIITAETSDRVSRKYRADGVCPLLFTSENLGKTVFLTKEEAEKALKGDEGE